MMGGMRRNVTSRGGKMMRRDGTKCDRTGLWRTIIKLIKSLFTEFFFRQ